MKNALQASDTILASLLVALVLLIASAVSPAFAQEALSSWNDTPAKTRIVDFVKATTTEGGEGYVAPEDRIAVFDNDGTLWSEQPIYFQFAFMLDRVKTLAPQHPEWKAKEPFKSILAGDPVGVMKSGERGIVDLAVTTHAGMTTDQFSKIVADWFASARHPKTGKPYDEMTFVPMRELLDYLRSNGFKTYIVSGGGVEFMRPMTEKMYGIPPEQVVGSTITTEYAIVGDVPVLKRLPKIDFVDDGKGKPAGINKFIGRKPIFVAGNSDGDYEMLRWVTAAKGPGFAMIVHHTDADREVAYDRKSAIGKLDKALDEAERRNWLVVDMKTDWKKIFAFEQ
ncbi:haloacid dehalogenase-like hydrolase [Agrobacterium sp. ICMP 7243]|uniref:phosphoserine phosphatase n=1 Tax=Rhizobium rhizogenes TaxID=359 RepID=A0A7S5DRZ9_RHIRH|nr:HAD family hydrolase [Rhizobium rhizogenes]KAA6474628.1 haloacid dehalogenase-like hydrolase [Agrobacterium sp. ICMP 7243]NTG16330.1 haloacid dehalogenase-like hydrolase [Rhizobium rhizogenes]NTG30008.1 haloacid dehalogenase-like hydrolase [Rhizobium rhizogenes]NTH66643.1 haloacid dehalogenase-like hydrolase [Rhizobium rhizogenes]QCL09895.1 haloacid dehalogenase-like hydrolase family protein [Rhizobium rhizogenes]